MIQLSTQLALFLDNRPGMLARVCEALAKAKVNIFALSTSDTVDHIVIRMVVDDPRKAIFLLEERGVLVVSDEILMVEGTNQPGSLVRIADRLAKANLNIEYAYFATLPSAKKGLMILRVNQAKKALKLLNS